jgi:hypothetical protein
MKEKFPSLLNGQECAILFLLLIALKNQGREAPPVSRVRLSELTLRRLWGRDRIDRQLLDEVQEWLSRSGWSLFFSRGTYAAIRATAVSGWPRLSSKQMANDLKRVHEGDFDFGPHLHLLQNYDLSAED